MTLQKTKIFDGKRYKVAGMLTNMYNAKRRATIYREKGYLARVFEYTGKKRHGYLVAIRKK